jgi:hypothetical protein
VLLAARTNPGPIVLENTQLARGAVVLRLCGTPDLPRVDEFIPADRLLIMRKALNSINC